VSTGRRFSTGSGALVWLGVLYPAGLQSPRLMFAQLLLHFNPGASCSLPHSFLVALTNSTFPLFFSFLAICIPFILYVFFNPAVLPCSASSSCIGKEPQRQQGDGTGNISIEAYELQSCIANGARAGPWCW